MMKQYGITKENMQYARDLLSKGCHFDFVMKVLRQIYEDCRITYK